MNIFKYVCLALAFTIVPLIAFPISGSAHLACKDIFGGGGEACPHIHRAKESYSHTGPISPNQNENKSNKNYKTKNKSKSMKITLINSTPNTITYKYWNKTKGSDTSWSSSLGPNQRGTDNLKCSTGEKYCYSAISGSKSWGLGWFRGDGGCSNCCVTCDGKSSTLKVR